MSNLRYRPKTDQGLHAAIMCVGGPTHLAKALGITHNAISSWKRAPIRRVPEISRVTGVPRHVLRPDFYDPPLRRGSKARPARIAA